MRINATELRASLRRRLAGRSTAAALRQVRRAPGDLTVAAPKVQQSFWCLDHLAPGQGIVNVSRAWRIDGAFDPEHCHQALRAMSQKHDCLRCGLQQREGVLQMLVPEDKPVDFAQVDLRPTAAPRSSKALPQQVEALLDAEAQRGFDPAVDPLLRLRAYQLADQVWVLHLVYHHAIMDGWSLGQFCQELGQQFDALADTRRTGTEARSTGDRPLYDFGDYARDQEQRGQKQRALPPPSQAPASEPSAQAAPPELALPFDFAPPKRPSYRGKSTPVQIDAPTWSDVEALAGTLHVSPISVLLAAFRLSLFEISGQRDFYLGNTAMTRNGPGLQQVLGAFVETLPIRNPLTQGAGFEQICQAEQAALAQVLEQESSGPAGAVLAQHLQAPAPALQAVLNYRGFSTRSLALSGCEVQNLPLMGRSTAFTLALNLEKMQQGVQGELVWNAARFTSRTASRIVGQFTATLAAVLGNSKAPHETLLRQVREQDESSRLLSCDAVKPSPPVTELLDRAFDQFADQPALRCGDLCWTYKDLDRASAAWARRIAQASGAAGDLVALALPRGANFVAALIGILRAGRAFVPLSPQDPPERMKRILRQADPRHLIAETDLAQILGLSALNLEVTEADTQPLQSPEAPAPDDLAPDDFAPDDLAPDDLAYVMFTSGSTGEPKGVEIPHRALANYLAAVGQVFAPRPGERMLSISATTFDSIIYEVLLPLGAGAELVMIQEALRRDPWHIVDQMRATAPQHLFATPALWRMLLEAGLPDMPQLKALVGGEALPSGVAAQILPHVGQLYNVYGPTEATVFSTWQEVLPSMVDDREKTPVGSQIGRPFPGYSLAVVDPQGQPVWPGMLGEIWISGAGLASGYYQSPERTAQSFPRVSGLTAQPKRWYRTGDQGRLLGDGSISCAGRLDDQLKISGQRVEPGEIENLLLASGYAAGAAVFALQINARPILVAFYVSHDPGTETAVRRYLQAHLPTAWVPGLVASCAALPLTSSGKLDRRRLALRAEEAFETGPKSQGLNLSSEVSPQGGFENDLAPAILQGWKQALGQSPASNDQDFFAAGGNSLLLITLLARIREVTECHLPVAEAFGDPTPRGLQALLAKAAPLNLHEALVCTKAGSRPDPVVFLPGLVPTGPNLTDMMQQAPQDLSCYLLQRPVTPSLVPQRSFADHARYYARVLQHHSPGAKLHLTGFSYGGAEAFETARQLAALGSPVASLTVIDNGPVFRKLGSGDTRWGEQGLQAEMLRRAHVFDPWTGDMRLVRGDHRGLLSLAMIAYGWEDFVEGEVAVHMVPAKHDEMLHRQAAATLQALLGGQQPDCVVGPQPGAADRRRVSHLLAKREPEAALDLICGISREHVNHPWSALVADQLALEMGKECSGLLEDWLDQSSVAPPRGVPAVAWHAARAQALLRLQGPQAALSEVTLARESANSAGRRIRDLEAIYGDLLLQLDRFDEAVVVLAEAAKQGAARSDISVSLGISLAKQGRFHWALSLLQKAKETGDCSPEVLFWLAQAEQAVQAK